jgi:hypothetical protein
MAACDEPLGPYRERVRVEPERNSVHTDCARGCDATSRGPEVSGVQALAATCAKRPRLKIVGAWLDGGLPCRPAKNSDYGRI